MFPEPLLQLRPESTPHPAGKLTVAVKKCAAVVVGNTEPFLKAPAQNLTAQRRALQHVHTAERSRHCLDVAEVHAWKLRRKPKTVQIPNETMEMTTAFCD